MFRPTVKLKINIISSFSTSGNIDENNTKWGRNQTRLRRNTRSLADSPSVKKEMFISRYLHQFTFGRCISWEEL